MDHIRQVLLPGGNDEEMVGVGGASTESLATGVVIGIGGSGVQTIARVRSWMRSNRPDAVAVPSVSFLGIDAVPLAKQRPPLPRGVSLSEQREFLNITKKPFNPAGMINGQLASSTDLQSWWDTRYKPPMTNVTDGLKRSRMLGRLAFYRAAHDIAPAIEQAMRESIRIQRAHVERGLLPAEGANLLKVSLVASSCGGTGSSGFLEVLHKIWVAATALNIDPEVRAFVYLPGVFQGEAQVKPGGTLAVKAQRANAYAFFRELDHFITHSDQLNDLVARPTAATLHQNIAPGQLVKQVFAIDSMVEQGGLLTSISDLYDITAEAIYQFSLTDIGRPLVGEDATNTDQLLELYDEYDKRRIYCGLGVARVVLPGETLRRHLSLRFIDWLIRDGLLFNPPDLSQRVREHDRTAQLIEEAVQLVESSAVYTQDDDAVEFLYRANQAPDGLEEAPESAYAARTLQELQRLAPKVVASIAEAFDIAAVKALPQIDPLVQRPFIEAGLGLPFGAHMLKRLDSRLSDLQGFEQGRRVTAFQSQQSMWEEIQRLLPRLREIETSRFLFIPLAFGRKETARKLGEALRAWATSLVEAEEAKGKLDFLERVRDRVGELRRELDAASKALARMSDTTLAEWQADHLIGKDAGPIGTTTMIPSDILPEVEDCSLAVDIFETIRATPGLVGDEASKTPFHPDFIKELLASWTNHETCRGPFSLGADDAEDRTAAERSLVALFQELAETHAVRGRLPADLAAAAELTEGRSDTLRRAVEGLAGLSRGVCWRWNPDHLDVGDDPEPSVSTAITRHTSVAQYDHLLGATPTDSSDPERIIALSVEWGVPAHAIGPVPQWQAEYERALASFDRRPLGENPPHLDKRWAKGPDQLDPLVPPYYERRKAVRALALGLFGSWAVERCLASSVDRAKASGMFDDAFLREGPTGPIWLGAPVAQERHYQGRILRRDGDVMKPEGRARDLGAYLDEAIDPVGKDFDLRESAQAFVDALIDVFGVKKIVGLVKRYQESVLEKELAKGHPRAEHHALLGEVFDSLSVWRAQLDELDRKA